MRRAICKFTNMTRYTFNAIFVLIGGEAGYLRLRNRTRVGYEKLVPPDWREEVAVSIHANFMVYLVATSGNVCSDGSDSNVNDSVSATRPGIRKLEFT